ncbi:MAG TPA: Hpt domain-containing protein [Pyrinomonadaceae bacterium]|nr:Hpt domain-containing protein [Pyrinomonadaceae bacterium]
MSQIEMVEAAPRDSVLATATGGPNSTSETVDMAVLASFEEVQGEGEPDLVVELMELYLDDTPRQLATMRASVAGADESAFKRAAHSLKGSSANLGVRRIAALCEEVGQTKCDDSFQGVEHLLAKIEREFERVGQIFAAERQRRLER